MAKKTRINGKTIEKSMHCGCLMQKVHQKQGQGSILNELIPNFNLKICGENQAKGIVWGNGWKD